MIAVTKELFVRRNLIRELVLKDLKVRYSRPLLGFFWAFLSPLLIVAIFYLVFSIILQVKIKEAPFLAYLMSAVFSWRFFQDSLIGSTTSLVDNKNLIREANFPHYLIPLSIVLANAINFLPSLGILIVTSLIFLNGVPIFIVLLPVVLLMHLILVFGASLISAILYVKLRDTKYILEALLQLAFYLTPAFYSIYLVKDSFPRFLFNTYMLNPFVGLLNLYRISVLKGFYPLLRGEFDLFRLVFIPAGFAIGLLLSGLYLYNKNKYTINDYLSY